MKHYYFNLRDDRGNGEGAKKYSALASSTYGSTNSCVPSIPNVWEAPVTYDAFGLCGDRSPATSTSTFSSSSSGSISPRSDVSRISYRSDVTNNISPCPIDANRISPQSQLHKLSPRPDVNRLSPPGINRVQQRSQTNWIQPRFDIDDEKYSRKVFVGGLPPDIDEYEIHASFSRFGPLTVDWPHKAESKSYFPPQGYAFLLFQNEISVQGLVEKCVDVRGKLYVCVSSPTMKDKPVEIRPWKLTDTDLVLDHSHPIDPRKTIFVGGVPRPLRAVELAMMMDRQYGGVCYAGIDVDPELKYPKGAARVAFSNQKSYIAAITSRFVQLKHGDMDKKMEMKPYVLEDQMCDECHGIRCNGSFAPFFCSNVNCLQYYCQQCWNIIHARGSYALHTPLVKDGTSHVVHQKSRDMRIRESRDHQMVDNILDVIDANNPNNSIQRYLQQRAPKPDPLKAFHQNQLTPQIQQQQSSLQQSSFQQSSFQQSSFQQSSLQQSSLMMSLLENSLGNFRM